MAKKKSYLQAALERHKDIPLPPQYKEVFFNYIRLFFKWVDHINNAISNTAEAEKIASTPAAIKKWSEMRDYLSYLCIMRDGICVTISIMIYIGMNIPDLQTLEKFKKTMEIIDDNILSYLAIIQRYYHSIKFHHKLSLNGFKKPITFDEIQSSKNWPGMMVMEAAFVNGQKILNITSSKTR